MEQWHLGGQTDARLCQITIVIAGPDRTYQGIFDLCIESLSDSTRSEIERDVVAKKNEYEAIGVQEYYILDDKGMYKLQEAEEKLKKAGLL